MRDCKQNTTNILYRKHITQNVTGLNIKNVTGLNINITGLNIKNATCLNINVLNKLYNK